MFNQCPYFRKQRVGFGRKDLTPHCGRRVSLTAVRGGGGGGADIRAGS